MAPPPLWPHTLLNKKFQPSEKLLWQKEGRALVQLFWLLASGLWPLASGLWPLASGLWPLASGFITSTRCSLRSHQVLQQTFSYQEDKLVLG